MLAYVFWHRPAAGVVAAEYEDAMRRFHSSLDVESATFRVAELPFGAPDRSGYEDWYLVADWTALGELNAVAVDSAHRGRHDAAATRSAAGWGGVYALVRGKPEPPGGTLSWLPKPAGAGLAQVADPIGGIAVWQRQMVLGPAPELCVAAEEPSTTRIRL